MLPALYNMRRLCYYNGRRRNRPCAADSPVQDGAANRLAAAHGELASPSRDRKADALSNVKKARDLYVKLIDESSDAPTLAQEALMGAAKGSETLGDLDQAKKYYERLTKDHPQSVYGKDAAKRLERIASAKDDFDKLQNLNSSRGP